MIRRIPLILFIVMLSGCCSRTTLVLLPEDSGKTGEAVMQTSEGEVSLDTPYTYTEVKGRFDKLAKVRQIEPEEFKRKWGKLLDAEPIRPQSYILNFLTGGVELTPASTAKLPDVINAMRQDAPVEVNIIGHSDTVGDEEDNYKLSLERANAVHDLLLAQAPWLTRVLIQSHGENDPLIPTADNVAEPKNRRVEILIR